MTSVPHATPCSVSTARRAPRCPQVWFWKDVPPSPTFRGRRHRAKPLRHAGLGSLEVATQRLRGRSTETRHSPGAPGQPTGRRGATRERRDSGDSARPSFLRKTARALNPGPQRPGPRNHSRGLLGAARTPGTRRKGLRNTGPAVLSSTRSAGSLVRCDRGARRAPTTGPRGSLCRDGHGHEKAVLAPSCPTGTPGGNHARSPEVVCLYVWGDVPYSTRTLGNKVDGSLPRGQRLDQKPRRSGRAAAARPGQVKGPLPEPSSRTPGASPPDAQSRAPGSRAVNAFVSHPRACTRVHTRTRGLMRPPRWRNVPPDEM